MIIKFYWTKKEYTGQALLGVVKKRFPVIALLLLYTAASFIRLFVDGNFGVSWVFDIVIYVYCIMRIGQTLIGVFLQCRNLKKAYVTLNLKLTELDVEMIVDPYKSSVTKKYSDLTLKEDAKSLRLKGTKRFDLKIPKEKLADREITEIKKRLAG